MDLEKKVERERERAVRYFQTFSRARGAHGEIAKTATPIHPGEILRAGFMEPLHLGMNRLALDLRVPVTRVADVVHECRGIIPDTALPLARYFNTSAAFWLNLQSAITSRLPQDRLSRTMERDVRPASFAAADTAS
jgi:addiction module HigA family antidote